MLEYGGIVTQGLSLVFHDAVARGTSISWERKKLCNCALVYEWRGALSLHSYSDQTISTSDYTDITKFLSCLFKKIATEVCSIIVSPQDLWLS